MKNSLFRFILSGLSLGTILITDLTTAHAEEVLRAEDTHIGQTAYSEGDTTIPGLVWGGEGGKPEFIIEENPKNGKPLARVNGRFELKNTGTLFFTTETTQRAQFLDESGNFFVLIPLTNRKTMVNVQFIDDYGNKKKQDIEIVYENFIQNQLTQQTKKKWNFDGGASLSYLAYTQVASTSDVKIDQIGITPKLGIIYNAGPKLDIGGSIFGTLIGAPLKKTPEGLSTPRFYGINMRIGYKIYSLRTANIYLMTGPYFWGMIVPPSPNGLNYGVVKLSGPQLFLVGRMLTEGGRSLVGYIKGASILDGDSGMSDNHEFAMGGAFQITSPKAKRKIMMNFDFASAHFLVTGERIQLNSMSLGLSTAL